jgi:cAMP-specific phosphodiesterase 4
MTQILLFLVLLVTLFLTDAVAFVSAPDSVNRPVQLTMLAALIVFSVELLLNCACRDAYVWSFYFWMDVLGTFSIVADVPFLSSGWLPDGAEIGTTLRVSRAAKIGARASKDGARLLHAMRSISTLRVVRPWGGARGVFGFVGLRSEKKPSPRSSGESTGVDRKRKTATHTGKIAANLDASMSKSVAVVVLLTILAAPLLLWDDSDTIPAAYHSSLTAVSSDAATPSAKVADAVASGFHDFFSQSERKPVALAFAGNVWVWTNEYPRSPRSTDRLVLSSGACVSDPFVDPVENASEATAWEANANADANPCVALELDIALVNKWTALLNIGMVLFVIVELVLVSALLTMVTDTLVVTPLERIFENIKKNMDRLFVTFEAEENGKKAFGDWKRRDRSEGSGEGSKKKTPHDSSGLEQMEAAIDKMARLVKHVAGSNAQGAHMFREYVDDENVDENTRAWLMDMNSGGPRAQESTPKKDLQNTLKTLGTPLKSFGTSPTMGRNNALGKVEGDFVGNRNAREKNNSPGVPARRLERSLEGSFSLESSKNSLMNGSYPSRVTSARSSLNLSRRASRVGSGNSKPTALKTLPPRSLNESSIDAAAAAEKPLFSRKSEEDESNPSDEIVLPAMPDAVVVETAGGKTGASIERASREDEAPEDEDDGYFSDDFFDDDGAPLKAGPELQLRQARARSRTRAQGAVSAVAAARASGVSLPENLDHRLIDTWEFDVLRMTGEEARAHVLMMFGSLGLLRLDDDPPGEETGGDRSAPRHANRLDAETASAEGFCTPECAWHFLKRIESGYRRNAYHNFQHAVDVTHTVYRYVVMTEPRTHVTQTEKFALMVAALSHDLDHPGVNNAFLVNTRDPLATVYNDSSVLENAHVAGLYSLIRTRQLRDGGGGVGGVGGFGGGGGGGSGGGGEHSDPSLDSQRCAFATACSSSPPRAVDEANVFALLDDDLYRETRSTIIAAVLHTDMSHHFKMVSQMEVFHELHSEGIKANTRRVKRGVMVECIYQKEDDRRFMLCVLLHAADIANAVKPLATYRKWANRVLSEFFAQGDLERKQGLPVSPMMDAASTNFAMSQINFIEFVVAPLYANFARLFPECSELLTHLIENRVHFQICLERELDGETSEDPSEDPAAVSSMGGPRDEERRFEESGGARAKKAGEGKAEKERETEKLATRARFRALLEKHEFSKHALVRERLAEIPAIGVLMGSGSARNRDGRRLERLPSPGGGLTGAGAASNGGPGETCAAQSRRTLLAVAAAGVRDVAIAAGASTKKMRRPSK